MKKTQKNTQNRNLDEYRLSNWDWNFAENIVTFSKRFLKPSDTIGPESTRQFNIKILSTIINEILII